MIEEFTHDPHHHVGAYQVWTLEKYRNGVRPSCVVRDLRAETFNIQFAG